MSGTVDETVQHRFREKFASHSREPREEKVIMRKLLARLITEDQGTETLEWGLVCGLIVVGAITAIAVIGPKITTMWNNVSAAVP